MMKSLFIATILAALYGCSDPAPIDSAVSQSIAECLNKDWVPRYFANGVQVDFTCIPRESR